MIPAFHLNNLQVLPGPPSVLLLWPHHHYSPLANSAPGELASLSFIRHSWLLCPSYHSWAWRVPAHIPTWTALPALCLRETELIYSWNGEAPSVSVGKLEYVVSLFAEPRAEGSMPGCIKFKIRNLETLCVRCLFEPQCLPALSLVALHPLYLNKSLCESILWCQVTPFKYLNWLVICTSSHSLFTYHLLNRADSVNHF